MNKTDIITDIKLFDFVKAFLTNSNTYNRVSDKCKKQHMFMTFRILATKYPTRMHQINGCESIQLMDSIQKSLVKNNTTQAPQWIYAMYGGNKKQSLLETTKLNIQLEFCRLLNTELKNLPHYVALYGVEEIKRIFTNIEKALTEKTKKKKGKVK